MSGHDVVCQSILLLLLSVISVKQQRPALLIDPSEASLSDSLQSDNICLLEDLLSAQQNHATAFDRNTFESHRNTVVISQFSRAGPMMVMRRWICDRADRGWIVLHEKQQKFPAQNILFTVNHSTFQDHISSFMTLLTRRGRLWLRGENQRLVIGRSLVRFFWLTCPWARYWTSNCSWCSDQQPCTSIQTKASAKCNVYF